MLVRLLKHDDVLLDDPVRPSISPMQKMQPGNLVYMWLQDRQIGAIVCMAYKLKVPTNDAELLAENDFSGEDFETDLKIILYSIWSYQKGCGQKLVQSLLSLADDCRVITMSPKTDMARDFHLRNGAVLLQENAETVNYEY